MPACGELMVQNLLRFGAVVDQLGTPLAQPLQCKRRARAVALQPLQAGAVLRLDTHAGVHREAAVFEGQHLPGLEALDQAAGAANARRMRVRTSACTWAMAVASIPLAG